MRAALFSFLIAPVGLSMACQSQPAADSQMVHAQTPVYESPKGIAGDPDVIVLEDGTLRMYFSAEDFQIGVVESRDQGRTWSPPNGDVTQDQAVFTGRANAWDQVIETVEIVEADGLFWMFYTGYREGEDERDNTYLSNYQVGVATSSDGLSFERVPESIDGPVIPVEWDDPTSPRRHALTSPGVVYADGRWQMVLTGWNVTDDWTGENAGFHILLATSDNGIDWTFNEEDAFSPQDVPFTPDANETELAFHDGRYYIGFSADNSIGVATATDFNGPYSIHPTPIVSPSAAGMLNGEVTAPSLVFGDGILRDGPSMRVWYHRVAPPLYYPWTVGYSEGPVLLEP